MSAAYGRRYPSHAAYVGAEGDVLRVVPSGPWAGYIEAVLDRDGQPGLFLPDELEDCDQDHTTRA